MKNSNLSLSLGLDVKQFHEGLDEICRHFADSRSDDYLNGLVQQVVEAKESLFGGMFMASAKRGVLEESRKLNARLSALARYLDLNAYDHDAEVVESAKLLRRQLGSYGRSLSLMRVDSRLTAVDAMLRDMGSEALQPHVMRLPELSSRLEEVRDAKDDLRMKQLVVDQANSSLVKPEPLLVLKREAAAKLVPLVAYLEVMATKDAAAYGRDYAVVTEVITRLNATRRKGKSMQVEVELDDEEAEETAEKSSVSISA